jgi:hypothetical protein
MNDSTGGEERSFGSGQWCTVDCLVGWLESAGEVGSGFPEQKGRTSEVETGVHRVSDNTALAVDGRF